MASRAALSARLDGELDELEVEQLRDHLTTCAGCRLHEQELAELHRALRVRAADPVPDLTSRIVEVAAPLLPHRQVHEISWIRYALFTVALTQLVLAVPLLLLGQDPGAGVHAARELGAFEAALAAGMLVACWQPSRARGLFPAGAALVACMTVAAVADMASGRAPALGEAHHVLDLVGVTLLWALSRPGQEQRSAGGAIAAA